MDLCGSMPKRRIGKLRSLRLPAALLPTAGCCGAMAVGFAFAHAFVPALMMLAALPLLAMASGEQRSRGMAGIAAVDVARFRLDRTVMRESEARFSKIFRLSPDAMCISCGIGGPILDVNEHWENLFGYTRAEAIGITVRQLRLYASGKDFAQVIERNRKCGDIRNLEVEMRDRAGAVLQTVLSGEAIMVGSEPCFISIIRDVTEQRRAEAEAQRQREQLAHLARVAALGELSGALAHELNQPLTAILTNAQAALRLMARDFVDLREIRDILDDIVKEDKRAGEVIRRLRALFMKGKPQLQTLDLNEVLRETLALARSHLGARRVAVVPQPASGLRPVQGDRVQLQQVLLNLIFNACEAMTGNAAGERRLTFVTANDSGGVRIDVSDTGTGIARDLIGRIFDSFFTTKANGLGFGLSISRTIIIAHGGRIEALNNPEGGATFRITLPVQNESCHDYRSNRVHGR